MLHIKTCIYLFLYAGEKLPRSFHVSILWQMIVQPLQWLAVVSRGQTLSLQGAYRLEIINTTPKGSGAD